MSHILYRLSPESAPVFLPGGASITRSAVNVPGRSSPRPAPRGTQSPPRSQCRAVLHRYAHCIHKLEIMPPNIQQNIDLSEIHYAKEPSNYAAYSRYEYYPALEISCLVQPDGVIIQSQTQPPSASDSTKTHSKYQATTQSRSRRARPGTQARPACRPPARVTLSPLYYSLPSKTQQLQHTQTFSLSI